VSISNVSLAQKLDNVANGWQSFVTQQITWLVSADPTVTLQDPYNPLESVTVRTLRQLVSDWEAIIEPSTGSLAQASVLLQQASVMLADATQAQTTFDGYNNTFITLRDQTTTARDAALVSANAAEVHKNQAGASASAASTSASNAATSATAASNSATASGNSATNAAASASDAYQSKLDAAASAVQAAQSASGYNAGSVAITGGTINGTSIGATTRSTGAFTTLTLTTALTVANGGTGATTADAARTNLGLTTVGSNLSTLADPSAIRFLRVNADNSVSALTDVEFRTAIGAGSGGGTGTVTSVGLAMPAIFTVTGSPVTTSGTLTASLATQAVNLVWASPGTGSTAGAPTFRALVAADIPNLDAAKVTTGIFGVARGGTGIGTYTATNYIRALNATTLEQRTAAQVLADIGAQAALGFTPVQQGGGTGQSTNKLYVGWGGSNLLLQVDATNFGSTWPISVNGNAASVTNGVYTTRSVTAGVGLTGGGTLATDQSIALGTPGTLTTGTTNSASGTTHTHAVTFPVTSVAGKTGAVTVTAADVGLGSVTNVASATAGTANTNAQRDASGDITSRLFRPTYGNEATIAGALAYRVNDSTDNYIRFCSDTTAIKNWLGISGGITVVTASSSFTAVNNTRYLCSNSITATLPLSPAVGDTVYFVAASGTGVLTVARNGQNIMGLAENMTVDIPNFSLGLVFADASTGWRII
jgi:hypothetical protein